MGRGTGQDQSKETVTRTTPFVVDTVSNGPVLRVATVVLLYQEKVRLKKCISISKICDRMQKYCAAFSKQIADHCRQTKLNSFNL